LHSTTPCSPTRFTSTYSTLVMSSALLKIFPPTTIGILGSSKCFIVTSSARRDQIRPLEETLPTILEFWDSTTSCTIPYSISEMSSILLKNCLPPTILGILGSSTSCKIVFQLLKNCLPHVLPSKKITLY
jgi:hypothetical protein